MNIANLIEQVLERHQVVAHPGLEEIMTADAWARETILRLANGDKLC